MKNCNTPSTIVCTSDIIGKPVIGLEKEFFGIITEIVWGKIQGDVRYVVITKSKEINQLQGIPWNLLNYHIKNNAFELKLSIEALDKMPKFDCNHYPKYTPQGYSEAENTNGLNLSKKQKINKDSPSIVEQERFIAEGGDSQPLGIKCKK